jgi:hypothetical protein
MAHMAPDEHKIGQAHVDHPWGVICQLELWPACVLVVVCAIALHIDRPLLL